ncbi:MAG: choice-of-anchor Q domain-containing protein, partial [Bacteroidota bacterium]
NTMYNEDPKFMDELNMNFNLTESSPAVDKGTDSVDVHTDIDYGQRPQGFNHDIGAYESEYSAAGIDMDITLFLEGSYNSSTEKMNSDYYAQNLLALSQPFNNAIYNYDGNESVQSYLDFERDNNGNTQKVVSWVLINISDKNNPANIVAQAAGLLWDDGSVTATNHESIKILLTPDLYYVAVKAFGHLGVMTATPFDFTNSPVIIDFSDPGFSALGGNDAQNSMNGKQMFICGDANGDGIINAGDRAPVWTARNSIGNIMEDINLDGICNASDRAITWNNRNRFSYLPY